MASFGRKRKSRRKAWISLCAVAALVLGVGTVTRMTSFKLRMKQYEPGTVVRFEKRETPYGTVLRFEPAHRFHTGIPAAAYRLRLADGDEEIWLAERVVEQAMVPVAAYRLRLADGGEEIWLAERVVEQAMVPVVADGEATGSR